MKRLTFKNAACLINLVRVRPSPAIFGYLSKKAGSIFRRHPGLQEVRLDLKREPSRESVNDFTARARLVLPGYDRIIEKRSNDLFAAIAEVMEVADRQLRRRARLARAKIRPTAA